MFFAPLSIFPFFNAKTLECLFDSQTFMGFAPPQYVYGDTNSAYYNPVLDFINMPPIEYHDDSAFY